MSLKLKYADRIEDGDTTVIDIDFTPHYHAITNAGKSQFARIADAIAELIDNSIQACSFNKVEEKRIVNVSCFVGKTARSVSNEGFLCVTDNGCGMDENCLREFAIYSLDQETRGRAPTETDKHSYISKFGVGAKQAGFFLGKSIRVLSKVQGADKVCELYLDQGKFRERFEAEENVYREQIYIRSKHDTIRRIQDQTLFASEVPVALMDLLKEHLISNDHFTAIIIHFHNETLNRLLKSKKYVSLPLELAEIYHFHLHPDHSFNTIASCMGGKFAKQPISTGFRRSPKSAVLPPLDITVQMEENGRSLIEFTSLREENDIVTSCLKNSAQNGLIRFEMHIPDPYSDASTPLASQLVSVNENTDVTSMLMSIIGRRIFKRRIEVVHCARNAILFSSRQWQRNKTAINIKC